MVTNTHSPEIKRIGETGQLSVGKALAGKLVRVEEREDGVMLRFVVDVPEKDAWWAVEPYKSQLKQALAWAAENPPAETDLGSLLDRTSSKMAKTTAKAKAKAKKAPSSKHLSKRAG